ncbi:MAG: polyprenyl synthetase family protein [Pirellulaceae bacterium]|nr:polyprenyl synthetase family protein [Pirellulaceae bacterium]
MDRVANSVMPEISDLDSFSHHADSARSAISSDVPRLKAVLSENQAWQVEATLERELMLFEELLADQLDSQYPAVARLMESAAALQGKRLRPRLVLLSALACGAITQNSRRVAAVVELVHAATLVHDDVLDSAETRRGAPASHVTWGNRASILLGDILFSKAFILAASAGSCFAATRVGQAGQALCEGELRQQDSIGNWSLSMDQYLDILRQKTGDLCAASSLLGAWSAGAGETWQRSLETYGMQLGIAFQIYDDWLDVWGTAALGKPLGNDVANRKPTLPTLRMLETAVPEDRSRLVELLEAGAMSDSLREALDRSDASSVTLDTARQFAQSACTAISCLPDSPAKQALIAVAQQAVRRNR